MQDLLQRFQQDESFQRSGAAVLAVILSFVAYLVAKRVVLGVMEMVVKRTASQWDDILLRRGVFDKLAYLAPAFVLYAFSYVFPSETEGLAQRIVITYVIAVVVMVSMALLTSANDIWDTTARAKEVSIKGYLQILKLIVFLCAGILIFSTLFDRSPWGILSGIGAMTAVLLLVFKDTILSFVASIQIATNDMVRVGDWISMPKYGADGDVIDIALHTVKVQNFDKTITTVPTHALIEDSFQNWRGMQESGGRRIKRAIHIDVSTVRFLDDEAIEKLSDIQVLAGYLKEKREALANYNQEAGVDPSVRVNGRRLTNVGTFRAYLVEYLRANPNLRDDMTFLVRQLAPGPDGLPIELYVFTKSTQWAVYEAVQADIFDHILAAVPEFGLRVFQRPTGADFGGLATQKS